MRTTRLWSAALLATVVWVGCARTAAPPEIRLDRVACARCGMLVSELAGSAAYRTRGGEVRVYDDLACLLEDRAEGVGYDQSGATIWVHDRHSALPLRAEEATFVRSAALRTPMGGGLAAFADASAAAAFAGSNDGEVLRWSDLDSVRALAHARVGVR